MMMMISSASSCTLKNDSNKEYLPDYTGPHSRRQQTYKQFLLQWQGLPNKTAEAEEETN
jgi:hypothetical protein